MIATTTDLMDAYHCVTGYTQSDEITLVFPAIHPKDSLQVEEEIVNKVIFFNGRTMKIASLIAGYCTARFNFHCLKMADKWSKDLPNYDRIMEKLLGGVGFFDARVFNLPDNDEVLMNVLWRSVYDCQRNSKARFGQFYLTNKEVHGLSANELIAFAKEKYNVSWNDSPDEFKYGCFIKKIFKEKEGFNPITKEKTFVKRHEFVRKSFNMKTSTKENLEFLMCKILDE
jgi:tRNA(His) guanylyltransferase